MKRPDRFKKIIFFCSPQEVDEYIANKKNFPLIDELFIAMEPSVHSYLLQRGFRAENTLNYFDNDSHMMLLKKSKIVVEWLRENINFVTLDVDISQSLKNSFIFWARHAIHYCLWATEIVLNAVDKHKPQIIVASLSGGRISSSARIMPEEKYLGQIVHKISQVENLEFADISRPSEFHFRMYPSLGNGILLLSLFVLKYIKFYLWRTTISVKNIFTAERPILFTTKHNMDRIVKRIHDEGLNRPCYFLKGPVIHASHIPNVIIMLFWKSCISTIIRQKRIFENLDKRIREGKELFSYKNISFAGIISQKIKNNISNYILGQLIWAIQLGRFFDILRPCAVLSNGNRLDDMMIGELCKYKNIPAILISHGSHVFPKNEYENIEWGEHGRSFLRMTFSFLALQSPLAEGYLEAFPSLGRNIKTGPLVWGRPTDLEKSKLLFSEMFKEKYDFEKTRIILHAGTTKQNSSLRFYVYETTDEYIQALCELASAVEKIPNTILIIKFRPRLDLGINDLTRLVPFSEKTTLSINEPFIDMLGMSDLLVSFSSTTIEEALQNRIPVLLYGGRGRYQHIPAYEIKPGKAIEPSAVYHVREAENLECAIRNILDLNIKGNKNEYLFRPYIYPEQERTSIVELLKK